MDELERRSFWELQRRPTRLPAGPRHRRLTHLMRNSEPRQEWIQGLGATIQLLAAQRVDEPIQADLDSAFRALEGYENEDIEQLAREVIEEHGRWRRNRDRRIMTRDALAQIVPALFQRQLRAWGHTCPFPNTQPIDLIVISSDDSDED